MFELLVIPPIRRALIAVLLAGLAFPVSGVVVLEMNLIPLRFALMHGALLGGAIAVSLGISPLGPTAAVLVVMVLIIARMSRSVKIDRTAITALMMTASLALAAALIYRNHVSAAESLSLLWGNAYSLTRVDLLVTAGLAALVVCAFLLSRRVLIAVLHDPEVAKTAGIRSELVATVALAFVAFTVLAALRLLGALLLDVLVLLPAIAARQLARSATGYVILATLVGISSALIGFTVSLIADIPLSTGVAIPSLVLILVVTVLDRRRRTRLSHVR